MTDEEKAIIKAEIYKAYCGLKRLPIGANRWSIAINMGINRAQEIINKKAGD